MLQKSFFLIALTAITLNLPKSGLAEQSSFEIQQQLNEKQQLLDNAIEEIVYLKDERQKLKRTAELSTEKFNHTLTSLNLLREGRQYEATVELKKVLNIDNKDAEVMKSLAFLYSELKMYEQATQAFELLIQLAPQDEKIYSNLGFLYAQQSNHSRAVDYYLKALSLNPNFPVAHYNLALSFTEMGKREKAVEHFKTAAELFEPGSQWKKISEKKAVRYSALKAN